MLHFYPPQLISFVLHAIVVKNDFFPSHCYYSTYCHHSNKRGVLKVSFSGFSSTDFQVFHIDGLEERMQAIRTHIQPKFRVLGERLTNDLSAKLGMEMFLHIAKHARRTKNPPNDTWLAIANNKRGYKKHPHFQVGLFDDHVFIWLACIYELPNKQQIAAKYLEHIEKIQALPNDFVISDDHTQKNAQPISETDLKNVLERFERVKKAECLIGRHISSTDPILQDGEALIRFIADTFDHLIPLYRL